MCGIFGLVTSRDLPTNDMVTQACRRMAHRGPDGEGVLQQDSVTLGHRRLSILDLSAEAGQPMRSADGRHVIVFNGEIYNHLELRPELEARGHTFRTTCDTETLLCAYATWGAACLERLHGMFAFAVADFERREIFLARDPFGIKPLYYRTDSGFAFSSELPPLSGLPGFPAPEVDTAAVAQFFRYQYIASPRTIFASIRKLPPAHCMRVDFQGQIQETRVYFDCRFKADIHDHATALQETDRLIGRAVVANTLSDVPVGVYLSGGIDSTLVAMNLARSVSRDIPAFTIAFREEGYSELPYAQEAAQLLGLKLNVEYVESPDMDKLPAILAPYGEPYGDSSVLPTWHVAQLARRHVTVVLSGDGGDELFGGYNSYVGWLAGKSFHPLRDAIKAAVHLKPRTTARHLLRALGWHGDRVARWHNHIQYNPPTRIEALLQPPYRQHAHDMAAGFEQARETIATFGDLDTSQYLDLHTYLPECILPKVDITSMQHSLEVRPALLDTAILRHACRLPQHMRYNPEYGGKLMLKEILLREGFSRDFVYRRKQGFGIPVHQWFDRGGKARALLEDMLSTHTVALSRYLVRSSVDDLLARHDSGDRQGGPLWLLLAFSLWIDNQKDAQAKGL